VKLRSSKRALEQIDKALEHVAERSPSGAAKIEARISAMLALLQIQPHAGIRTRLFGVRRIFLTPYPYLIDDHAGEDENRRAAVPAHFAQSLFGSRAGVTLAPPPRSTALAHSLNPDHRKADR
jgi:plasmid stabilization system protein ParE